jgi:hypothetical protein
MSDYKIHGFAQAPDQFMAAGMTFYTVTVANADMTQKDSVDGKTNKVLDAIVEGISTLCAPVIMGTPTATTLNFVLDRAGIDPTASAFLTALQAAVRTKSGDSDVTVTIATMAF